MKVFSWILQMQIAFIDPVPRQNMQKVPYTPYISRTDIFTILD